MAIAHQIANKSASFESFSGLSIKFEACCELFRSEAFSLVDVEKVF